MDKKTNLKTWVVMAVLLVGMAPAIATGGTIYIDAGASGANDGTSWVDAYNYLQDALAVAQDGNDIWVAEGTYKPDVNSAKPGGTGDDTAAFQLINGVAIYGGFPSGGGQWEEIPVMDPGMLDMFDAFSMGFWWNTLFTGAAESARLVGQEMVNGVQSNHYQMTETASWAFAVGCSWTSAQDDAWVAVDGAFPVKRQSDASGQCADESGEVHFLMEISNVNQPVNISPPM